jgi:hypothetical protein
MKVSEIKSMLDRSAGGDDVDLSYLLVDDSEPGKRALLILPRNTYK